MAISSSALAQRPRGRPQRLPFDPLPFSEPTIDGTRRMAWLLATTRLLSPVTSGMSRETFMLQMRGRGISIDASRLSRWESGSQQATPRLLDGYESVVGMPPGTLLAVQSLLRRTGRDMSTPEPSTQETAASLDDLFDRIERHDADGGHWLRLATDLTRYERVYLHPSTWSSVCTQLVGELTRSGGIAFLRRYEAAAVLMGHPQSQRHLSRSLGRFVMHPDAQSVAPALTLLREVADDAAGELVLRLMSDDNKILSRGATGVAPAMVSRGHFPPSSIHTLEHHTGHELRKGGAASRRTDAIDLATQLPHDSYERILGAISDHATRQRVSRAWATAELVPGEIGRAVAEGVAAYAEAATMRVTHDPDQMLRRLVREALFHVQRERRHLAAMLICVSPYGPSVAQAVLRLTTESDDLVASMSWSLLRRLGNVLDRTHVTPVASAESRPGLRARAFVTLGLSRGPLDSASADLLLDTALDPASNGLRHASIFALGMARHDHLDRLTAHESDACRRAALWWRGVGSSVHDDDAP